jgi:hypothetical protein
MAKTMVESTLTTDERIPGIAEHCDVTRHWPNYSTKDKTHSDTGQQKLHIYNIMCSAFHNILLAIFFSLTLCVGECGVCVCMCVQPRLPEGDKNEQYKRDFTSMFLY